MSAKRRKRHTPEQIVQKLHDAVAMLNAGKDQAADLAHLTRAQGIEPQRQMSILAVYLRIATFRFEGCLKKHDEVPPDQLTGDDMHDSARCAEFSREHELTDKWARRAVTSTPNSAKNYFPLIRSMLNRGHMDDATRLLSEMFSKFPADGNVHSFHGLLFVARKARSDKKLAYRHMDAYITFFLERPDADRTFGYRIGHYSASLKGVIGLEAAAEHSRRYDTALLTRLAEFQVRACGDADELADTIPIRSAALSERFTLACAANDDFAQYWFVEWVDELVHTSLHPNQDSGHVSIASEVQH